MKETLLQFAGYNLWANKRIVDAMLKLSDEIAGKEVVSSFPFLHNTVTHIWSAESIWLQRLQLAEQPVWMEATFTGSFKEACNRWLQTSQELQQFLDSQADDTSLAAALQYYDRRKQSHENNIYSILLHTFNHSTYHRGQLVTMLRQLGETHIPQLDLIAYLW